MIASQLSHQERLQLVLPIVQAELAVAAGACLTAREAAKAMESLLPPVRYKEAHLLVTKSLRLMEQGFREMKSYVELRLGGIVDDDKRLRANRLLAEADKMRQQALLEMPK